MTDAQVHYEAGPAPVTVRIETPPEYRATEIVADLRNVAETLFHPFRSIAFWDGPTGEHVCREASLGRACPHPSDEAGRSAYARTVGEDLSGILEVRFPHADVSVFLG